MKKRDRLLAGLVLVLITIAAILFALPFIRNYEAFRLNQTTTVQYTKTLPKKIAPAETIEPASIWQLQAQQNQNQAALGRVAIPALGMVDNIYVGLTTNNLALGAVTLFPRRVPEQHNFVLLGHNMGYHALHFGALKNAKVGQLIYLDYLGKHYQYRINKIEQINETEIDKVQDSSESKLSLVTCSAATRTPKRILVEANLENSGQASKQFDEQFKVTSAKNQANIRKELWQRATLPLLGILLGWLILVVIIWRSLKR
ncbi:class A sortase [Weissella muntiaci]|uniref:Class A sortase n=1 Tax=Weissella muntiaci TaxID=2508881 RepID=A0A6C2C9R0_9LACO|nr:class A sortase [Weissella muntiaci]TYC50830.1 class A sortase [Weissella muntiaci]